MKTAATIFGLSAFTLSTMAGSPVNLLDNPSFEVPGDPLLGGGVFMNWDTFGNVEQWAEATGPNDFAPAAFDGMFSAKMFSNGAPGGVQGDSGAFQTVNVGPAGGEKSYRATITVQSQSVDPLIPFTPGEPNANGNFGHLPLLLLQFQDAAGNTISQPEAQVFDAAADPNPFDQWLTTSVEGFAPAGTENVTVFALFIGFGDDPGALFWDAGELIEIEGGGPDCPDDANVIVDDSTAPWEGFMNVSELPENGGGFVFGSNWGVADLSSSFDDGVPSVTMSAAEVNDPDPFWYVGGGAPGAQGNKIMEANLFQSVTTCFAGETVSFTGFVQENSLAEGYEASIFIKDFEAGFATNEEARVPATPGPFTVTLDAINDPTRTIQYGFTMTGPNVWPGDAGPAGTVTFSSVDMMGGGCNAADIAEPFNILDLSDIAAFVSAFTTQMPDADLAAPFGVYDLNDISAFVSAFTGGCP